jgi:hypothetical protein
VIEIRKGQSAAEAKKQNPMLGEQETVNQTQLSCCINPIVVWPKAASSSYGWYVVAVGKQGVSYGESDATSFSVKTGDPNPEKFNPPVNQSPVDGKLFTTEEVAQPINFRWTPVLPLPKVDVVYKIRVIEIKAGQSKAEALKGNKPIAELEVKNEIQTTVRLSKRSNGISGSFEWDVTAIGTERVKGEEQKNYGTSKATTFGITNTETDKDNQPVPDTSKNKNCITYKAPIITGPATGSLIQMYNGNLNLRFIPSNTMQALYRVKVWRNTNQKSELIYERIFPNNFNGSISGLKLSDKKTEELTVQMQALPGAVGNIKSDRAVFQKSSCAVFENNGFSKSSTFSVASSCAADYSFSIDSAKCVEDKKVKVYCHVVFHNINALPAPNPTLTNAIFVDNATNLPITTSNFSTSLSPLSLLPAETDIPFSFDAEGETCDKTIRITYDINWNCPSGPQHIIACVDSFKLPCCYCNYCDKPENMIIQDISHSATPVATDNLIITQQFNISPKNISQITAEIVYMEEDQMDDACKQCRKDENEVYHFLGTNTAAWNSGAALNASSGNNASTFPTKILEWGSNAQGNVDFNLTIGLPGTAPLKCCERHGRVCIRYSFTDIECKTCTQLVCYTY